MIEHAGVGLRAFLDGSQPSAFTYVESSPIPLFALLCGIGVIPDGVFYWLMMPHALWWLALALDVAEIWTALWLLGLYGTMVRNQHAIENERVTLYNGSLGSVAFDRGDVADATSLGIVKRRKLPRERGDGSKVLALGGVPVVDIRFKVPVNGVTRVFVASDRPEALCAELMSSGAISIP
ncbi:MAG TPA: hypothetical protein VNF68_04795 [Candidatus Baltobacteraceae bacterium]|nr:hypothetical protein [Candidatus Baltobacteraceae bacterium]